MTRPMTTPQISLGNVITLVVLLVAYRDPVGIPTICSGITA